MKTLRLVVFAKAPLPGLVKTRLIPALGAGGAAHLARQMLEATLSQALAADIGPVELCSAPAFEDSAWQSISLPPNISHSSQGPGDLGARLSRVAARIIAQEEAVLLFGTDAPQLDAAHLRHAAALLRTADATLFPTSDGGYILLGLNRFHPLIFSDIPWSTADVASTTLARLDQLGWSVRLGPRLHDIDTSHDLQWVPSAWLP